MKLTEIGIGNCPGCNAPPVNVDPERIAQLMDILSERANKTNLDPGTPCVVSYTCAYCGRLTTFVVTTEPARPAEPRPPNPSEVAALYRKYPGLRGGILPGVPWYPSAQDADARELEILQYWRKSATGGWGPGFPLRWG
jgi:hypothetical protein